MTNITLPSSGSSIFDETMRGAYDLVSTIHAVLTDTSDADPNVTREFLLKTSALITQQSVLLHNLAIENEQLNENIATFTERLLNQ